MESAAEQDADERESDGREELRLLARALAVHVERREHLGDPRPQRAASAPVGGTQTRATSRAQAALPPTHVLTPPAPEPVLLSPGTESAVRANESAARSCATLGELRSLVASCTACGLARTRTQTVFSDGREHARVLFVGEAPGQSEDEQGVPFVGAAGQLLTDIIQKGMGLSRSEVYIANVLKCRPPGNRDPEADEKALCTPYLDRQIELVDPELLIALGLHAARHLLRSQLSMGRLRGTVHRLGKRKVIATYHPAYLLRTPSAKKDCWQDIQLAMRELGLSPPRSGPAPR